MHRTALTVAIVGMLVLSGVGCLCGLDILTCTTRSLIGAAVLYVATWIALKLVVAILVSAMMRDNLAARPEKAGNHGQ